MIENPYEYTGPLDPVRDKLVCIPRNDSVKKIVEGIKKGDYWVILGPVQIGKTTFLRQLQQELKDAYYIYFNLQVPHQEEHDFYQFLMNSFWDEIPAKKNPVRGQISDPRHEFLSFLRQFIPEEDKRIVLLFDEIEGLPYLERFLDVWQTVYHQRSQRNNLNRYSIILTASTDPVSLKTGPSSPFNVAKQLNLGDFSTEESSTLIDTIFDKVNIKIEPEAKERLISHISGHPQMLQQAGFMLVDAAKKENRKISRKDVERTIEILLRENTSIDTLNRDLKANKKLERLVLDILKKKEVSYNPYKKFSFSGAGCIVRDEHSHCKIRNRVYERFFYDYFGIKPEDSDIFLIKEKSKNIFFDKKKKQPLPYGLKQIRIRDFYEIKNTGVSDIPLDTQWIFLTGDNAFGKTAVLRAITIGFMAETDNNAMLMLRDQEQCKISVEIHAKGKTLEKNVGERNFEPFKNFAVYGPSRLEIQSPESQNKMEEKSSQTYSIFNTDGILLNIENELIRWHKKEKKFKILKQAILTVLRNITDIKVMPVKENGKKEKQEKVFYIEKENGKNGKNYGRLPFKRLASGHKSIIAMVGDILLRLFELQPEVQDPGNLSGIIIIDELELHLHPKWQRILPSILSKIFPNVQFIASTHSVVPILGAPEKSIFLKVNRSYDHGIKIQRIDIEIENLLINSILTSPLFDLDGEEITPETNKNIHDIHIGYTYEDIKKREETRERLRNLEPGDFNLTDDLSKAG